MSLINREALLSYVNLCASCGEHHTAEDVIMMIKTAPTVDAVPVVRCRECKHRKYDDIFGTLWCNRDSCTKRVKPDDFCSYGERKDGDK